MVETFVMTKGHPYWEETISFANGCSWRAGAYLAKEMRANAFQSWERVIIVCVDGNIAGFCTVTEKDALPEEHVFTPFVGFVFVSEAYRGQRLSETLITSACEYAGGLGYESIYLTSDHVGLYEKYGFVKVGDYRTIHNTVEQLFVKPMSS